MIQPTDGELVTGERTERVAVRDGCAEPRAGDAADVAFITVVTRYTDAPPAVAFILGFGLGAGAIAASVAHDCHNVVAVGGTREALAKVVNAVFQARGGLAVHDGNATQVLPLPIAGLMSDQPFAPVAARLRAPDRHGPCPGLAPAGAIHDAQFHGLAGDSGAETE